MQTYEWHFRQRFTTIGYMLGNLWLPVPWNNKSGYNRTMGVQGSVDSGNKTVSCDFPVYGGMLPNDRISHYSLN